MENLLTTRRLPLWREQAKDVPKYRVDSALVGMIVSTLQLRHPGIRIGKRFAIEYALSQWLHNEGLLKERVEVPEEWR